MKKSLFMIIFILVASACIRTNNFVACKDECPSEGYVECQGTQPDYGNLPKYVATCGNFDDDECLEYQLDNCSIKQGPAGPGFCDSGACRFAGTAITRS